MREALEQDGYTLLPAIDRTILRQFDNLTRSVESDDRQGGLREPQRKIPGLDELTERCGMHARARELLGSDAQPVRWILFDKTPEANWLVPWHRDMTICVRERVDLDGYGPWSVKDGMVHVRPPLDVLRGMVTLRLHIDRADGSNGALRVVPGSHRCETPDDTTPDGDGVFVEAAAGEVLAMKPLLLHASSKASRPARRRVLHIEYAAAPLPQPLAWA